jgi:hypothetical protein
MNISPPGRAHRYFYFGICLTSRVPLPALLPWPDGDADDCIAFDLGRVPQSLPDCIYETPLVQISARGEALFRLAGFGCFLVRGGRAVVFEALADVLPEEIVTFLTATIATILLYQRDFLPLHASAVEIGGRAAVICAPTGTGKSTLAAALVRRGHRLIADDIAALALQSDGSWHVVPGGMTMKLGPDSSETLGLSAQPHIIVRRGQVKRRFSPKAHADAPLAVGAVFRLTALGHVDALQRLSGIACIAGVEDIVSKHRIGQALGRGTSQFAGLSALASRVPFYRLHRGRDLGSLDRTARVVEDAMGRD